MPISPLTNYVAMSPNRYAGRAYPITKITIHHMAGDLTVEGCGSVFASPSRQASSNYGVGSDGRIGCYVDEADAAWTSADWDNDNRAVTIEVADADTSAWSPSGAAYEATVRLCVDICKRNGIKALVYTGGPDGTMTEHLMFSSTSCPGPWWHARMAQVTDEINRRLKGEDDDLKYINNYGCDVFRVYNPNSGLHHFPTSAAERDSLVSAGWRDEGLAFKARRGGSDPVYRMYNPASGDHLHTTNFEEAKGLQKAGWAYEGVPFFAWADGTPVYRLYNPFSGEHFMTASSGERDRLAAQGWKVEGGFTV